MSAHFTARLLARPWTEEHQCWWHVAEALRVATGIECEPYGEEFSDELRGADKARLFEPARHWPWLPVSAGAERALDIVIFQSGGLDDHVGLVVQPGDMFHCVKGRTSKIESYRSRVWRSREPRFYRREELA